MSALVRAPLVAAALVASAGALAALASPAAELVAGVAVALVALPLALVSADRPRRVLWSAIAAVAVATALRSTIAPPALEISADPRVAALREALAAPLRALIPEPEGGIVLGIVLGERASIARDLRTAFAVTGTSHLLAISGFNMTLVAATTSVALRGRVRPAVIAAATVLSVAAYSVLVGPQPSVVRAALMAAVGALGLALGRRGVAANALGAAAAAMLVIDPRALEDVGFLLSVSATAGLIAWERPLARRFARLPSVIADGLAATIAASVPTVPIVAAVFGRVSLVSPAANLAAVPLFAPIMLFGAAAAAVGAVARDTAWPLAMAAYVSAGALRHVVELGAAVPLAAVTVPQGAGTGAVVAAALATAIVGAGELARRGHAPSMRAIALPRWPAVPLPDRHARITGAAALLCVGTLAAAAAGTASLGGSSSFRLRALDVGQGDAFLVESDGRYALIDGGPDPGLVLRQLGTVLPPWQRRIDLLVLSHEHADHGAGLLGVLDRYEVGLAIEPVGMGDVPFVRQWSEALARARVPRRAVAEGAVVRLGTLTLRILGPGRERRVDVPSLAMRIDSSTSSVLLLGDSVDDAVADLLLAPEKLRSRLLVPQHHGAESPHTAALVAAVAPELVVISVGALNRYGHPAPATLRALEGLPVYRTDRYGTVDVDLDGHPLVARTAKAALPPDRGGSLPRAPAAR